MKLPYHRDGYENNYVDHRHKRGYYFSKKNMVLNWFDSSWELKRMKQMDIENDILMWKRTKYKIPYSDINGKNRNHIPDFYVEYKDGQKYIEEMKGSIDENTILKIKATKDWCEKNNFQYKILGEKEIKNFENLEYLMDNYSNKFGNFWRPSFLYVWMKAAIIISQRSTCLRHKVGCVITPETFWNNYSFGFNGSEPGAENGCKSLESGQCGCVHAEENALKKLDELNIEIEDSIMFVTLSPCKECAEKILKYPKIKKIIYLDNYRSAAGRNILIKNGVNVIKYSDLVEDQNKEMYE